MSQPGRKTVLSQVGNQSHTTFPIMIRLATAPFVQTLRMLSAGYVVRIEAGTDLRTLAAPSVRPSIPQGDRHQDRFQSARLGYRAGRARFKALEIICAVACTTGITR